MSQGEAHDKRTGRGTARFAMHATSMSCMVLLAACAQPPKAAEDHTVMGPPVPPRLIDGPTECKVSYPAESRRKEQQGRVEMRALVDLSGRVAQLELARSSGFPLLDQAALSYAKCLRYEPGRAGEQPSVMWTVIPVRFALTGSPPAVDGWASKVAAAVRQNIILADPEAIPGNPGVEIELTLAPDGAIVGQKITKSSGFASWDKAASFAIVRTERLPLDIDGKVPPKLTLTLRPKRQEMP